MSTAHRPTWDPAQAKDVKSGSRQYSARDMASQTKLKFRQPGQTSVGDVKKRDLRTDLLLAEHEAKNKKRKAAGQDPLPLPPALTGLSEPAKPVAAIEGGSVEDDAANKRRKMLQEALELDGDGDSEDEAKDKGKGKAPASDKDEDEDGSDEDSDDDEDETAQLLAELERIKRERAAEEERKAKEINEGNARDREEEIATSNPLLNLEAALGQRATSGRPGTFAVKKRWDDDVIFKNQGASAEAPPGHFVNDLLRTEFHKKFMAKFIK